MTLQDLRDAVAALVAAAEAEEAAQLDYEARQGEADAAATLAADKKSFWVDQQTALRAATVKVDEVSASLT